MAENRTVRFGPDTWAQGTRRGDGPFATDKADINNMRQWDDGALGARPAWGAALDTLDSTDYPLDTVVFPAIATRGSGLTEYDGYIAYSPDGDTCEFFEWDSTLRLDTVSVSAGVNVNSWSTVRRVDDYTWLIFGYVPQTINTQSYGAPVTPTPTVATSDIKTKFGYNTFECRGGEVHQGRAFYFGTAREANSHESATNRIFYSDAYDYLTFTSATQFFDVDGRIEGCISIGANLFIWTKDARWYMLQGRGDPAFGTLNALGKGRIPAQGRNVGVLDRAGIFMSSDAMTVVHLNEGGGMEDAELSHLGGSDTSEGYNETPRPNPAINSLNDIIILPELASQCVRLDFGVWTTEVWGNASSGGQFNIIFDELNNYEVLVEWVTSEWIIRRRPTDIVAPELLAGKLENASQVEGTVTLPRITIPDRQVRIRRILIDGRTYSANGAAYPAAALTMTVEDGKGGDNTLVLGPAEDLLSGVDNAADTPIRITAVPTDALPYTHFSDIIMEDIVGLTIETVTVEFEVSPGPVQ